VGVCRTSAYHQETPSLSSDHGCWAVSLKGRQKVAVSSQPYTVLHVNQKVHKVSIFLDCDLKAIPFSNASDSFHQCALTNVPASNSSHPFFCFGIPGDSNETHENLSRGSTNY
ncbi:RFPLA protein, partial [Crocuta crocuta]